MNAYKASETQQAAESLGTRRSKICPELTCELTQAAPLLNATHLSSHAQLILAHLHTHLHPVLSPHVPHPRRSKIGTANRYPYGSLCLSSPLSLLPCPMKYQRMGAAHLGSHLSLQQTSNLPPCTFPSLQSPFLDSSCILRDLPSPPWAPATPDCG